jgi:glycine/D-amino acid oxidase-like deaminating enzyme
MKSKAISLGVEYIEGTVTGGTLKKSSVIPMDASPIEISSIEIQQKGGGSKSLKSGVFVNAAGAWAGNFVDNIASLHINPSLIHPLPVKPRKRCIFTVHCSVPCSFPPGSGGVGSSDRKPAPSPKTPLVIDPSGCYFRLEGGGGRFIVGVSPSEDSDPDCSDEDLQHVDHNLFNEIIWPNLGFRVPAFESIKQTGSWCGFYEYNTLDQNAIIGYHSDIKNLLLCNGFSGHGLQQSPAAGRAVAELITHNAFQTINLERFSFQRVVDKKPIYETGIV